MAKVGVNIHGTETVSAAAGSAGKSLKALKTEVVNTMQPLSDLRSAFMLVKTSLVAMVAREVIRGVQDLTKAFYDANGTTERLKAAMAGLREETGRYLSEGLQPAVNMFLTFVEGVNAASSAVRAFQSLYARGAPSQSLAGLQQELDAVNLRLSAGTEGFHLFASGAEVMSAETRAELESLRTDIIRKMQAIAQTGGNQGARGPGATAAPVDPATTAALLAFQSDYARTSQAQLALLLEKIRLYSSDVFDQSSQAVKDVLAMLRAQLPVLPGSNQTGWNDTGGPELPPALMAVTDELINARGQLVDFNSELERGAEAVRLLTDGADVYQRYRLTGPGGQSALEAGRGDGGLSEMAGIYAKQEANAAAGAAVAASFAQAAMSVDSLRMVMDPLGVIFNAMFTVLEPFIDEALTPVIGALTVLGQLLGLILVPVIQALTPIIELLAKVFVWLYNNILLPIGFGLATVFVGVVNAITAVINAVIWFVNLFIAKANEIESLEYSSVDPTTFVPITYEDLTAAGTTTIQNNANNTSVMRPPNIKVYVTIQGGVWGAGGLAEVGRGIGEALEAYIGTGGVLHIEAGIT